MTETIRYSQLGNQDLRWGRSTFEVTLADGRVVILDEIVPILVSASGKRFKLEIDDNGTLTVVAA